MLIRKGTADGLSDLKLIPSGMVDRRNQLPDAEWAWPGSAGN